MKHLLIDFDKLVVGQKVWDILKGEGRIINLTEKHPFPILIEFPSLEYSGKHSYSKEGYVSISSVYPSLYLSNPFELISGYPKEMEVSLDDIIWNKRIVVFNSNGKVLAKNNISDCGSLVEWNCARETQEPQTLEITIEEIAERFGVHVNNVRIKD